jgi:hypothetical protein
MQRAGFAGEKPEHIEWAFQQHRLQSNFMPTVHEINDLILCRRRELWEAAEEERRKQERVDLGKSAQRGQTREHF